MSRKPGRDQSSDGTLLNIVQPKGRAPLKQASSSRDGQDIFNLFIAAVDDYAILLLDLDGHVTTWNAGGERLAGYENAEIVGRHFSTFYTPEDLIAGRPARDLAEATAAGQIEGEGWRVRRDGTRFYAATILTALRNDGGRLRGFGLLTHDLTERRAAEVALRASEERFRCCFDEARIGMLIINLAGCLESVNDAFCAMIGFPRTYLIGTTREIVTHPDDLSADASAREAMLTGNATSRTFEKRYIHAAGHEIWASINLTLIRDGDGLPLRWIAQVQDITERRDHEQQLAFMADHDPLTGLLNRRSFQRELAAHLDRVARDGPTGSLLMIDLDNFKYFNDTQGHSAGDRLIERIAKELHGHVGPDGVLARLGGDEFALLLPNAGEFETQTIVNDLLNAVRHEAMPPLVGGCKWVTASIGIARFDDGESLNAEEIMANADAAMYDVKEAGGDGSVRHGAVDRTYPRIKNRMRWVEQINDALANGRFELLAQPVVPLLGDEPPHYELLLHMRDRGGGLIAPGAFLDIAERTGLIAEIDRWAVRRAIDMLAEQRELGRNVCFEVNLSGTLTGDLELLDFMKHRLERTGVPPDRLIIDVSETAAVAHVGRAVKFAERLRQLGVRFAIDDFGSAYGSFYYLKHMPFDYLKIGGEFVRNCTENETDRLLISAVVKIARGMGKRTIAEFVTNHETVDVLAALGVDYGQGFHLGIPAPLERHLIGEVPHRAASRLGVAL